MPATNKHLCNWHFWKGLTAKIRMRVLTIELEKYVHLSSVVFVHCWISSFSLKTRTCELILQKGQKKMRMSSRFNSPADRFLVFTLPIEACLLECCGCM